MWSRDRTVVPVPDSVVALARSDVDCVVVVRSAGSAVSGPMSQNIASREGREGLAPDSAQTGSGFAQTGTNVAQPGARMPSRSMAMVFATRRRVISASHRWRPVPSTRSACDLVRSDMRRFAEHLTDGSRGRGRDRYRSCIVLLVIAAVAGVASLAQAAAAESARGLGVKVQASNPLAPTVTLTNNTAGVCQVVTTALGALVLTEVRQGATRSHRFRSPCRSTTRSTRFWQVDCER